LEDSFFTQEWERRSFKSPEFEIDKINLIGQQQENKHQKKKTTSFIKLLELRQTSAQM